MLFLSNNLRFEEARILRDRITKIQQLNPISSVDFARLEDLDVFALVCEEKRAALVKLFMRSGKIVSSATQIIKSEIGFEESAIYKQAVLNYYSKDLPLKPKQILIPFDLGEIAKELENFLRQNLGKKIPLYYPKSGEKKRLCELALQMVKRFCVCKKTRRRKCSARLKNSFAYKMFLSVLKFLTLHIIQVRNALGR